MSLKSLDLLSADIQAIHKLLKSGTVTITSLTETYLSQVEKFNPFLKAVLFTAPREVLFQITKERDREWLEGKARGPLHGVPVLLKDNIDTDPSLGMPTTAGSFALLDSRPKRNATLVDLLTKAGAIILGKTNLSELMNNKGTDMMAGWSAVGGQCISAYVRGGIRSEDKYAGHSSPGGSSTGSAVAVSAGFAPVSIGTETCGSLIEPAIRAALYTLKPTTKLISQQGVVPVSHSFDSAGPMAKTPYDLAILMDVLTARSKDCSYTNDLKSSWGNLRIGALNPAEWRKELSACEPNPEADAQMDKEIKEAYRVISPLCAKFVPNIRLNSPSMDIEGYDAFGVINNADYKTDLEAYLQGLEYSQVTTIKDLIKFNNDHSDQELPSHHPRQDVLEKVASYPFSVGDAMYDKCLAHLRAVARDQAIDLALHENEVDVIIGPGDSELAGIAAAAGYPIGAMPLSYLNFNGRPFGVAILSSAHREDKVIEAMSAWESSFPDGWKPPSEYGLGQD